MQTVAIVGVGLIGGSFARALKNAGFSGRVLGVGSPQTSQRALDLGVIDRATSLEEACAQADLVYLSHTISRILDAIPTVAEALRPGALVTDAGSTKVEICAKASQHLRPGNFLGGHPMAGKETRGVDGADPELFRNRTYVVTPSDPSELDRPASRNLIAWLTRIGANVTVMSPQAHDDTVALTSHLPQLASTILAQTVAQHLGESPNLRVAGTGLIDMTRLALSSHEIWKDILGTNREAIGRALGLYINNLQSLKCALGTDADGVRNSFEAGTVLATRIRTPQCEEEYPPKTP